jgi:hypothetical protein
MNAAPRFSISARCLREPVANTVAPRDFAIWRSHFVQRTSDGFVLTAEGQTLAPVLARHPNVVVEQLTDARFYSLSHPEADILFRIASFDEPEAMSRRLTHIPNAL